MKALITGATGFIGKNLAACLVREGDEVVCGGRSLTKLGDLLKAVKAVYLDVTAASKVNEIIAANRPDVVFHCAGLCGGQAWDALRQTNVSGTENVLEACLSSGVKKVVYLSSISVVSGNSQTVLSEELPYAALTQYGQSKIEAEKLAFKYREKGLSVAILRPAMVYGEEDSHAISLLIDLLRWRLFPLIGTGETRYPLVYIENLLDVMLLCVSNKAGGSGVYYVSDKETPSVRELFDNITSIWGVKPAPRLPKFLMPAFLALPLVGRRFRMLLKDEVCDINRLKADLGYSPRRSFYEGIRNTVEAHKSKRSRSTSSRFSSKNKY